MIFLKKYKQKTKASGLGVVNFIQKPFDSTTIFEKSKNLTASKSSYYLIQYSAILARLHIHHGPSSRKVITSTGETEYWNFIYDRDEIEGNPSLYKLI